MSRGSRIIFYLIIAALIAHAIVLALIQFNSNASTELERVEVSGWYYQLGFLVNFLLTIVSVYSFSQYNSRFPKAINICYILLLILIAVFSVRDIGQFAKSPNLFYSPKGLGTWINFGLLYFVAEEYYAKKVFKLFHILCYVFIVFNLAQIAGLGSVSNRFETQNAIRDTTVLLIWVYPFFFLDATDNTKILRIIKYSTMALVAFFTLAISSRSYVLIAVIFLLVKVYRDVNDKKNASAIAVTLVLMFFGGYYVMANIQNFDFLNNVLSIFSDRVSDDSRTDQLTEFGKQFDWDKLFTGVGITGTWNWSADRKAMYEWLDNQFVLVVWWFGLQTCLVYIFYLIYPIFRKNIANDVILTNAKIIIFFWILACGGFAIYVTISTKLFYYFITLIIGVLTLNKRYYVQSEKSEAIISANQNSGE